MARKTKTTEQKIQEKKLELSDLQSKLGGLVIEIEESGLLDKKKVILSVKIDKLKSGIEKIQLELLELEAIKAKENSDKARKERELAARKLFFEKVGAGDADALSELGKTLDELEKLKAEKKALGKEEKSLEGLLRDLVSAFPTGWTFNSDVLKRYLILAAGGETIHLQDTPSTVVSWDDFVKLVGIDNALLFAQVDKASAMQSAEEGKLTDSTGTIVTVDQLEAIMKRSLGKPKVIVTRGKKVKKVKIIVVPKKLFNVDVEFLLDFGLTRAETSLLKKVNIDTIGRLIGYSGETLSELPGIGKKRVQKIMDSIDKLKVHLRKQSE